MRPKLCRECHAPATHVEVEHRPVCSIRRDGSSFRGVERVSVYWCDLHTGVVA